MLWTNDDLTAATGRIQLSGEHAKLQALPVAFPIRRLEAELGHTPNASSCGSSPDASLAFHPEDAVVAAGPGNLVKDKAGKQHRISQIEGDLGQEDTPDSQARRFAVEHGVPPYIVPPDAVVSWTHKTTPRGIEVHLELDKTYSRCVEIWTVMWEKKMSGIIYRNGEFGDIRGVSAAAAFLKGVRVRASKFSCSSLDGSSTMTITAKPPMLPAFPVSVSTAYVLTRKGASLRWLPSSIESGRRSEDERIRRLSGVFAACQLASSA